MTKGYIAFYWGLFCWIMVATYVSVVLHRCLAHRAVLLPQSFVHFIAGFTSFFVLYVNPRVWVAEHRLHHAHSDTEADPDKKPGWNVFKFIWWSLTNPAGSNDEHVVKITKDPQLNTWVMRLCSNQQFGVFAQFLGGFILPYVLMGCEFWPAFGLWWTIRIGGIAVKLIQGYFAHTRAYGYRNFETDDNSVNMNGWVSTFLSAGESLQNNHHARPTSPTHAFRSGERDFGFGLVWLYAKLGIATFPQKSTVTPIQEVVTA